ncbi:acyltransferase [Komagataeibacter sp. FNDCR2]|uniref:acyltransferase family protein n=1 Tax=Komagataeibacter sp. FNDCR2 TaxID=2878682 RepID=UPI001E631724|nr:acyltransferase [Komagataeibacter sp. FNDCR2]MCE2574189.1 acyltransferase [Komagataeibacter sp. FNDCR2]
MFHTVDGLRGIAALGVAMLHMRILFPSVWYLQGGYLAVDLFFCLSGFVLAEAYSARLDSGFPLSVFVKKRLLRLWPLYALGLLIGAFMTLLRIVFGYDSPASLISFIPALFYIPWNGPLGELYPLNFPAWSLFYELVVNILMVVIWRKLDNRTLVTLIGLSGVALVISAFMWGSLNAGFSWAGAGVAMARVGFSFFLGILLWRMKPAPSHLSAWVPAILLAAALMVDGAGVPRAVTDLIDVMMVFPLIVWLGAITRPRGISLLFFEAIGAASYALYTIHMPMLRLLAMFISKVMHIPLDTVPYVACLEILAGLLTLAWFLNRIDIMVRRKLDDVLRKGVPNPLETGLLSDKV